MHVVGARFAESRAAKAVLGELRRIAGATASGLALRRLGSTRYEEPTADVIVAGRFPPSLVPEVVEVIRQHGGEVVAVRDEATDRLLALQPARARPTSLPPRQGTVDSVGRSIRPFCRPRPPRGRRPDRHGRGLRHGS